MGNFETMAIDETKAIEAKNRPSGRENRLKKFITLIILFNLLLPGAVGEAAPPGGERTEFRAPIRHYTYRVVASYPHDPQAFTQGLVIVDNVLYESTGLHGRSSLRRVNLETGRVERIRELPGRFFGEGVTAVDDRLIQLTWKANQGFVYDRDTFELLQVFTYPLEGWGLTSDGHELIASDGSADLYFLDPETFREKRRVRVTDRHGPVTRLNELEYVKGKVYANVWGTDLIAVIEPETGQVAGWIDLAGLLGPEEAAGSVDVLNGIAYDGKRDRLYVTGKLWPRLFRIELIEKKGRRTQSE
jgi:glutaminyl-peptide cyclotransferase